MLRHKSSFRSGFFAKRWNAHRPWKQVFPYGGVELKRTIRGPLYTCVEMYRAALEISPILFLLKICFRWFYFVSREPITDGPPAPNGCTVSCIAPFQLWSDVSCVIFSLCWLRKIPTLVTGSSSSETLTKRMKVLFVCLFRSYSVAVVALRQSARLMTEKLWVQILSGAGLYSICYPISRAS